MENWEEIEAIYRKWWLVMGWDNQEERDKSTRKKGGGGLLERSRISKRLKLKGL